MLKTLKNNHQDIFALLGLILILPALVLIVGSLLFSLMHYIWLAKFLNTKYFIFQPWTIMGGTAISIILNLKFILRPIELKRFNLYVFFGSCMLLGLVIVYLAAGNFSLFSFVF